MVKTNRTITESWPALKEDMISFLSDTDAWIIGDLKKAHKDKDWRKIHQIIDIMESVHNLQHAH